MLRPHFKYLRYMVRHKFWVFYAGIVLHAPIWRLIKHDWTKFLPSEWLPYLRHFYGRGPVDPTEWDHAWTKHIHRNDHHWQHWVVYRNRYEVKALEMPEAAVLEMVADWLGTGRTTDGAWVAWTWFQKNRSTMLLHPRTEKLVVDLLTAWWEYEEFSLAA